MASTCFDEGMARSVVGYGNAINPTSDTIKVALFSAYNPVKTHQFVADVTGATGVEISTTNYTRKTLTSPSITKDTSNNQVVVTFANPTWTSLGPATGGPTIVGALLFKQVTNDSDSPVLAWLAASIQVNGGNLVLNFDAVNGAYRMTI